MNPFEKAEEKYWLDGETSSEDYGDAKNSSQEEDDEEWEQKWDVKFASLKKAGTSQKSNGVQ
jgi:hypothetical protein